MAFIAYLRVSTTMQAESQAGMDAQFQACLAYAQHNGGQVDGCYRDEGVSGAYGLDKRPALLAALDCLRKGDVLLVAKRDRLGRDPIHVAMIERAINRKGARVLSAAGEGTQSDDPSNVLMRRMIDAFAEYERLIIGARTKAAMQAKRLKRQLVGSLPYGYQLAQDGIHLIEQSEEQQVVHEVLRYHQAGLGLRAIARKLNSRGFKTRTGNNFVAMQVKRILGT